MAKKTTTRITVDLSPQFYRRLGRLEEAAGLPSKAETIRFALQIFEWIVGKVRQGCRVQVVEADGGVETVTLFSIPPPEEARNA